MSAMFNGNPCYNPTNASNEKDITTFYNELSSLVRHIPKHNVLMVGREMNTHIVKGGNNFCVRNSPNRNGEYIADSSLGNKLV